MMRRFRLNKSRLSFVNGQLSMVIAATLCLCLAACSAGDDGPNLPSGVEELSMGQVIISLTGIEGNPSGFQVQLRNTSTNSLFNATSDERGQATFKVTPGIYEASASGGYAQEGIAYSFNGTSGLITVKKDDTATINIQMKSVKTSQVIVKELYNGGCMMDDGVTKFQYDKCIILYNNSSQHASLSNLCIGEGSPANGHTQNKNYDANGQLTYESEGFIPVWHGIWYFPQTLEMEPYSQVVINVHGAIDNTQTVSQSVNYANASYYCMYDPESGYTHTSYYPTPASVIPTSHYLKAVELGQGNGWALSVSAPALVVFQTHNLQPALYATDTANQWYDGGNIGNQIWACVKVPNEWIVDALEVFSAGYKDTSVKRLTADVDAGYVWLTNYQGHSLYRNVDKAATEALPENQGKLVYGYALGVETSTDPSGIDAEASAKNGAHIIYQDTNNSTSDFHERQKCSLRD